MMEEGRGDSAAKWLPVGEEEEGFWRDGKWGGGKEENDNRDRRRGNRAKRGREKEREREGEVLTREARQGLDNDVVSEGGGKRKEKSRPD